MADELKDDKKTEIKEPDKKDPDKEEEELSDPPSDEEIAAGNGWKPYKKYVEDGGDPKKWRTAVRFNAKGDLIGETVDLRNQVDALKSTLGALADHNRKMDAAYRKELERKEKAAVAAMDAAVDLGDKKAVKEAHEDVVSIKAEMANAEKPVAERVVPKNSPALDEFLDRNEWFETGPRVGKASKAATAYAVQLDYQLRPAIGITYSSEAAMLKEIEKRVKDEFPQFDKKMEHKKDAPPIPDGGSGRRAGSDGGSKFRENDLTSEERDIMNTFVKRGIMKKEDYINQIKMQRGA